jgi:hypothetical protein
MGTKAYIVGYKKPPVHSRFQKGRSGNRKGRPPGSRGLKSDLLEELSERLPITERGESRTLTKQRVVVKALANKAMSGDVRAIAKLLDMIVKVFGLEPSIPDECDLSPTDKEIVEAFLKRQQEIRNEFL